MINYVYDNSFDGLLTAIYEAYYRHEHPGSILSEVNLQRNLFDEYVFISTDTVKAGKVSASISDKISPDALESVFHVFLSEHPEAGTWIYEYLKLGWRLGGDVDLHLTDDRVLRVHNISRKVGSERHRMLGLVRFKQLEGNIYYAPIEPDYNITVLLAPHFAERFSCENWVIHDVRRNLAAVYNKQGWAIVNDIPEISVRYSQKEVRFQHMWVEYCRNISIEERKNLRLQMQHMPKKYWKHLIEKELPYKFSRT